jgi:hypothetical protein
MHRFLHDTYFYAHVIYPRAGEAFGGRNDRGDAKGVVLV